MEFYLTIFKATKLRALWGTRCSKFLNVGNFHSNCKIHWKISRDHHNKNSNLQRLSKRLNKQILRMILVKEIMWSIDHSKRGKIVIIVMSNIECEHYKTKKKYHYKIILSSLEKYVVPHSSTAWKFWIYVLRI